MKEVLKYYTEQLKTTSRCAALRATAAAFVDVPRAEFVAIFVEQGMKATTVGANFQAARRSLNTGVEHPARKRVQEEPAQGVQAAFAKLNAKKKPAAKAARTRK